MTDSGLAPTSLETLIDVLRRNRELRGVSGAEPKHVHRVARLTEDSRTVVSDALFVAVEGSAVDGHDYIASAVANGASAVVCRQLPVPEQRDPGVVWIQVFNPRNALLRMAHAFYGRVAERLTLIGVTGTNGKTTSAFLTYHLLRNRGVRVGLIGTLGAFIDDREQDLELTTPGAIRIHETWRDMEAAGCSACVMELSSHALDQFRVAPEYFDVGVFTNLSHDHLDYHETFETYFQAKKQLFDRLPSSAAAIYNADDAAGKSITSDTRAKRFSYSITADSDFKAENVEESLSKVRFRVEGALFESRLSGRFNIYNLLGAAAAVRMTSAGSWVEIAEALRGVPPVPGRLEKFEFDDGTTVFVDYAHTPDALKNVLETLRSSRPPGAALWCVFGCGGNRDRSKRPVMARVAEDLADRVIVTSDNPRSEAPEAIIDEVFSGFQDPASVIRKTDRNDAIAYAADAAAAGDVVLIAGKGHETYQIQNGNKLAFDDREEVKRHFSGERRKLVAPS